MRKILFKVIKIPIKNLMNSFVRLNSQRIYNGKKILSYVRMKHNFASWRETLNSCSKFTAF